MLQACDDSTRGRMHSECTPSMPSIQLPGLAGLHRPLPPSTQRQHSLLGCLFHTPAQMLASVVLRWAGRLPCKVLAAQRQLYARRIWGAPQISAIMGAIVSRQVRVRLWSSSSERTR